MIPKFLFLTNGVGTHHEKLESFELALRDAGIQFCNLVQVSSIIPPGCKIIPKAKGVAMLSPGEVTFVMMARNATREPNRLIAAAVGAALPSKKKDYGYISEHQSFGENEDVAGDYAEDLAATMLATTMGIEFDPAKAWDERKQLFKGSGLIIRTSHVAQSATGDKKGLWTSVVAAAVLIP
jgi:arginine decarboxylase